MSLTQQILDALAAAGLTIDNFTLSSPDDVGGVTVKSTTDDIDQIASAHDVLDAALPSTDYYVMLAKPITDPSVYVRPR